MLFGDFWFKDDEKFTEVELFQRQNHLGCFKLITDSDKKNPTDPYQFAPIMGDELLAKLPNHVFISQEFDYFYKDTIAYAELLKKHGKTVDVLVTPGQWHMS